MLDVTSRVRRRLNYYRRVYTAYLTSRTSHLTFWHDTPGVNEGVVLGELGQYYMPFTEKAGYAGRYDACGIPLLNYHGRVGEQYNPIAIAQYGLGNYNLFVQSRDEGRRQKFLTAANWLLSNLERNAAGVWVWHHHFDWEYRTLLRAPWYSALSQGQGISVLVRAHRETGEDRYLDGAERAFMSFLRSVDDGGVTYFDGVEWPWFEEVIVVPPTHILNGFIWASWGVYDYALATGSCEAVRLFRNGVATLRANLHRFDTGFWSLYELSGTRMRMLASPFYHQLHIAQLGVMHRLTGERVFSDYVGRWDAYQKHVLKRRFAIAHKMLFKLLYY